MTTALLDDAAERRCAELTDGFMGGLLSRQVNRNELADWALALYLEATEAAALKCEAVAKHYYGGYAATVTHDCAVAIRGGKL